MSKPSLFREDYSGQTPDFSVDFDNSVVHNVKILGWKSRNKRKYLAEGVDPAVYEGAFVNVNHIPAAAQQNRVGGLPISQVNSNRDVRDKFARLVGVKKKADGLYADKLVCNPEHDYTKEFLWWAKEYPDAVVLSHFAAGPSRMEKDGSCTVLNIAHVESVDIVSKGGTNLSLFESETPVEDTNLKVGEMIVGMFPESSIEDIRTKIETLLNPPAIEFDGDVNAALSELRSSTDPRVRVLVEAFDARLVKDELEAKRKRAGEACRAAKLPEAAVTNLFLETLVEKAETEWPTHIEDRRKVVGKVTPTSHGNVPAGPQSTDDFVKNFRSRN
jgi:hypothetical protein